MEKTTSHQIREQMRRFKQQLETAASERMHQLGQIQQNHFEAQQNAKEQVSQLNHEERILKEKHSLQTKETEEARMELDRAVKSLQEVQLKKDKIPPQIKAVEDNNGVKLDSTVSLNNAIEKVRAEEQQKIAELQQGIIFYKQRLGLDFQIMDGYIKVVYTYVDPRSPQRQFSFSIKVDESNEYDVFACTPAVDGVDTLKQELAQNPSKFGNFVIKMRQLFKQSCAC